MAQYSEVGYSWTYPAWTITGTNRALLELIAGPTDRPVITEIGFHLTTTFQLTTTVALGLGVPAANGVGPQPSMFGSQPYEANYPASAVQMITAWVKPPTAPTTYLRRQSVVQGFFNSADGMFATPCVWKFPRGLTMSQNQHLVVFALSAIQTGVVADVWTEWDN